MRFLFKFKELNIIANLEISCKNGPKSVYVVLIKLDYSIIVVRMMEQRHSLVIIGII